MQNKKSKIFIVDDHPIVRFGLRQIICLENDLEFCGEAESANEAIAKISRIMPDLVTVDISLDGDMSGFDLIEEINKRYHNIKTLVISMFEESLYVDRAIRCGTRGYIAKKYAYNTIIEGIRKVLAGELYLSNSASQMLLQNIYHLNTNDIESSYKSLSNRELEIFQMIGNGCDTTEIADRLGIKSNTVQTYKRQIKEKLGIKTHNDLVRRAVLFINNK